MSIVADREFNLQGWGPDKRLIEGPCGHCHHAVAFKEPEDRACLVFKQLIQGREDEEEEISHYFIMGICPRPSCQQATIVYRQEKTFIIRGYRQDDVELQERIIFPATPHRPDLPEEVPVSLRELYREAAVIEQLSPNGSAFLARRILEQTLRGHFKKPKGKLAALIDKFLEEESIPSELHKLMHDIREFGNIAGHPTQDLRDEWTNIDPHEASYTLDVVAEVLDHIYVKPVRRQEMRKRWESKKRGESAPLQPKNKIIVGGCEAPPTDNTEDDFPF